MIKPPLIQFNQVSKIYQTEAMDTHALSAVDLSINEGEFISISGPSGCGKTTLLCILGLIETLTDGVYRLNGRDTTNLNRDERAELRNRQVGFVFQNFNLIGDLSAQENVELPLAYRGITRKERRSRAEQALERVGMIDRREHFPNQLSGGQQQRVAVARALAGEPLILLADEPTGNLDSTNSAKVMELFTELHEEGSTICMVTHNEDFNRFATRVVQIFDGKIVSE